MLPNIVHLDFNYSKGFSEKTLKRIAKSYSNLKYLNLQKAEEVDHNRNQTYRNIHLGEIRRLMYENYISSSSNSGCDTEITDDGLSIVVLRCRKLEYLNISHRTAITDITINAIARSCLNLKYIDLKGCYNISKEAKCQLIPNVHVENIVGVSPHYISLMDKYLSQYDVCGLAELERKIRRRNDANNLNSALIRSTCEKQDIKHVGNKGVIEKTKYGQYYSQMPYHSYTLQTAIQNELAPPYNNIPFDIRQVYHPGSVDEKRMQTQALISDYFKGDPPANLFHVVALPYPPPSY
ncbi:hypothetical protein GLOIN_2v1786101 [Rhizophagus clarus]|uniref:F-box domain-containing protein n=1 Tax=Rhizophagus clarus TaxID=94130 RepID=A0A8H3L168_9GLOM|nr:hypothetical protein GLOIN_2v1786101 [Rhizophagus clarus]